MAQKRSTKNRLKRFGKWSDAHRADILEEVGLSEADFRALSRGSRTNTLDRALSLDKQAKDPQFTAAPQSLEQLRAAAGNAGQLRYGQAQSTLGQYGQSIDPWFQDYVNRTQAAQTAQQNMAAPVIAQAQTNAEQAGKTVLNADPNSEAGQNDALAAASRKALGDAFATMLSGTQTATNTQYTNQAGAVEAARVGEHTTQKRAMTDLLTEKGAFETDYLTTARDREHTKGLERKAFGLKETEAVLDAQAEQAKIRADRRKQKASQRDKDEDQDLQRDKFSSDKEKDAYQREHQLGPYKPKSTPGSNGKDTFGNTPKQRRAAQSSYQKAKTIAYAVKQDGDSWRDVYELIIMQNSTVDSDIARAAAMAAVHAPMGPKMRARLEAMGIRVPRPKKPKPNGDGTSSGGGGGPEGTGQTTP